MSIPTVAVTCTAYDQNGNAVAGGTFRARLNSTEIYNGFVVPEQVTGVADASGVCVLQLWPNALGVAGSAYRITAINPDTGQKYLDTTAVVPNSACNLHQIIVAAPYPTVDASQQALVAAQGALAAVTAQAGIATTKAAEASASATTAVTQAGIATTQAGTATTQAGIATTQATTATTQADIAAIQAGIATTKASEASASAATATTQAGTATTKASEAAASAATATTQAGTATTQAGVATTKASEAAASATNASNSAYTAGLSVDAAVTAKNQAVSSASAAASSATAASGSATAASTSASSASASASTATTQAGTATTQAGLATTAATTATSKASEASTYASNASASANTSTTQAGVATTQAGIATTQAGVATTQAGIAIANANAALSVYGSVTAQQASVTAAQNAATSATASAAAANSSAGNASGSAASALAIYGTTAAQQAALTNAQSAASLAQGYALSASSAIQQDLSGVTAQALHRSPNAVNAMFVYDTSKDSDGGAWTEKCQHTSWYNEALNGKWLGAHPSELNARSVGATVGPDKITNGSFSTASGFGITAGAINTNTGRFEFNGVATGNLFYQDGPANSYLATSLYLVEFDYSSNVPLSSYIGGGSIQTASSGTGRFRGVVQGTAGIRFQINVGGTSATGWIDNVSVKEVTALTTASGDYYQSTVDGKFYRLWKNLLTFSNDFSNAAWTKANTTATAGLISETAITGEHYVIQAISDGNVFTVEVKESGRDYIRFFIGTSTATSSVTYRFSTNTFTGIGSEITATSEVLADGYVRIAIVSSAARTQVRIQLLEGSGTVNYAGDITKGVFARRAQAERGTTATSYEAKTADGSVTETFRGNKADFPRLAGIVADGSGASLGLTIYDLTELNRPMWMRFTSRAAATDFAILDPTWASNGISCVAATNGMLVVGSAVNQYYGGTRELDFVRDRAISRQLSNYAVQSSAGLANRNWPNAKGNSGGYINTVGLVDGRVNAVAMTILPDAPVDAVTGLQVPTIAVATAGGVSVIQDTGVVRNSSSTSAYSKIILDEKEVGAVYASGFAVSGTPRLLGASFALTNYTTASVPALMGVPTVVA